jgi:hypothetical protein
VTNTTVYLYESDLRRAQAAGSDDRMARSVTYRGEVDTTIADSDGDGLIDGYESKVASITYYDYADRLKGEEVTDYSENYNSKNVLTQTTVYLYEDDLRRAKDADATARMSRSVAYHESIDADGEDLVNLEGDPVKDGIIDSEEDQLASVTYYHYEGRLKGEEVVDVVERYGAGNIVTGATVYYYETDNRRASLAREDDRTSRTVTYRGEVDHDAADVVHPPVPGPNGLLSA